MNIFKSKSLFSYTYEYKVRNDTGQFGLVFERSFYICFTRRDAYTSRKEKWNGFDRSVGMSRGSANRLSALFLVCIEQKNSIKRVRKESVEKETVKPDLWVKK